VSDARLVLTQTRYALKTLRRTPQALVFGVAFPIVLLLLFNAIFTRQNSTTVFQGIRVDTDAYYTAGMIAYAIVMSAFSTLAISVVTQRERGQLKRFRGTPMPPWTFIATQVLRAVVVIAVTVIGLLVVSRLAFDVRLPGGAVPAFVIYVVLGTTTMCTLGLALTSITSSAEVASTVSPFSAVVLAFISGVFVPTELLPDWLRELGRVFPLAHLAEGLQRTMFAGTTRSGLDAQNVAVLVVWSVFGVAVAAWRFKWEPATSGV
jgi:ABC-2 type transport system permease protein